MPLKMSRLDEKTVNAIRILSADAIQKANSGHPGLPLGAAPMAYELWAYYLKFNPKNPKWINRDRFILSAGHGSALLYSLNHLFGCGLTIEDIKKFPTVRLKDTRTSGIFTYSGSRSDYRPTWSRYGNGCRHGNGTKTSCKNI